MQLHSPAKINLYLYVTGKRPDGYHNLCTLMCPVTLFDTIDLEIGTGKAGVRCAAPNVPEDDTNLAWQAATAFFEGRQRLTGHPSESIRITIHKQIPVGAGLGGGSSNAATILLGLNRWFGNLFSKDDLNRMGRPIGADVPFFILQRPALATGIGDKLQPVDQLVPYPILLVYPGIHVSTVSVYKNLNLGLTKKAKEHRNLCFRERNAVRDLHNDLETVTTIRHPEITVVKESLLRHGALGALMTGSGSAVFGLFNHEVDAQRAFHSISQHTDWKLFLVEMIH
ncbi:4-diphosphocytidyl-2-C-methyl-D-erythritol kinase (EC [Olavius algarvensis associated proteobacterium Delta 3]|nr:4-diphosphocytidyl-2-C-methyl-D-erythritol kinase (EC [Olavius algarvensis associated proteobacterium Delta 3]